MRNSVQTGAAAFLSSEFLFAAGWDASTENSESRMAERCGGRDSPFAF